MPHAENTAATDGTTTRWISRSRATLAGARGARLGAGALGPDVQDAARVHPRDRSAAGAEGVNVDRRERDLRDADGLLARELGLAALEERDVRGRSAHVEGDEIRLAQEPRAVAAGGDAAGRPRQHGARRQPRRLAYRRDAAVRLQ